MQLTYFHVQHHIYHCLACSLDSAAFSVALFTFVHYLACSLESAAFSVALFALVILIQMLNVKKDWPVALTTVAQVGLMATIVATLHSVTTLTVQPGIAVRLTPNVDKD